jgi:putative dehydrogenase
MAQMNHTNDIPAGNAVGLLGLGAMGQGVARNLLRHGFQVYGFDLRADILAAMAKEGVIACDSPAAVGACCRTVIVLVVNAEQTEAALLGPDGAALAMAPGSVVVAAATVAPDFAAALAAKLARRDILMLDAPVTGGVSGAAAGTLSLLTAGPDAAYERCGPVLQAISSKVYRLGKEPGMGSTVKLINQLLVGVHMAVAAEAMAFGLRQGVDPALLYEVVTHGAANSWAFADRMPRVIAGDDTPLTALDIFVKDLGLVMDAAREACQPIPMASTAFQMFTTAAAAGLGREDDSALIRIFPGMDLPGPKAGPSPDARHAAVGRTFPFPERP